MIWLTWRQFRFRPRSIFGAVAVFAAVLAVTGPRLVHLRRAHGNSFIDDLSGADTARCTP